MATKILSNQRVTVLAGLASGIANWKVPLLSELTALTNVSGAVNWNSFGLNLKASDQKDDRTLTDAAGAQSRGFVNFGGNLQFVHPLPTDTTSIYRQAYTLFSSTRVELVVAVRYGKLNSVAPAAGDKWTIFHLITDAVTFDHNDVSRYFQVSLVARDDIMVRYVVPPLALVAITIAALAVTGTVAAGTLIFASALYQSWDMTKAVTWVSSDETKLTLVHPGIFKVIGAGTPTIKAQYPGATDSTPLTITTT